MACSGILAEASVRPLSAHRRRRINGGFLADLGNGIYSFLQCVSIVHLAEWLMAVSGCILHFATHTHSHIQWIMDNMDEGTRGQGDKGVPLDQRGEKWNTLIHIKSLYMHIIRYNTRALHIFYVLICVVFAEVCAVSFISYLK